MAPVPVEVIAPQKECGEPAIRLRQLPWLDLDDLVERRRANREPAMSPKSNIGSEAVAEIAGVPVKLVRRANYPKRRERDFRVPYTVLVRGTDEDGKSLDAVVRLA